jgi:predicted Zn-dependent peptidase
MTLVPDRPTAGAPRPWTFPKFERRAVAGGRMLAAHLPGRPLAVTAVVLDAGAATEPSGREGVAELVARALSEGTSARDAYGFGVAGERLGATWRASSDWDSLRAGFEVPVGELRAATELLAEAVRDATFADDVLDRVRNERVDELSIERSQPAARAAEAFAAEVFAEATRYAVPDGGDPESLERITFDDIRGFRTARLGADTATFVVVGDLTDVDLDELGRIVFDGWSPSGQGAGSVDVQAREGGRRVVVVDRPGSVQSMLIVGHHGPARAIDDYVATTTMSMVLGGMFSSRLNMKLREEKGYSYGAHCGFDTRKHGGVFSARTSVQNAVTIPALADLVAEIERMQAEGATDSELEAARSYRAGVFPISFAGVNSVAAGLGDIVVHDFRDDHFDALRAQVLDVTLDAVNTAAAERLHPDGLVTVVVGDAAVFVDDLPGLGLGPVEVISDGL